MKRVLVLFVLFTFSFQASAALAADRYIGFKAGAAFLSSEAELKDDWGFDTGKEDENFAQFGLGVMLGTTVVDLGSAKLRFELENTIRFGSKEIESDYYAVKGKVKFTNSTLAGVFLDFPINEQATPYIGLNAGLLLFGYDAEITLNSWRRITEDGVGGAVQGGLSAGFAYKLSPKWTMDLNARYLWSSSYTIEFDDWTRYKIDLTNDMGEVTLGFRYHF